MAAFSILKWHSSLQEGKSSLQNATRGFPYIRKWHSSFQEGKSFSRYNAASFYPEMTKFDIVRQDSTNLKNKYNSDVIVKFLSRFLVEVLLLCLLEVFIIMSTSERVVQSILYELGCILIGSLVMQFVPHEGQPFVLMVIFSLLAMVWNFVFNWIFDKLVPGDRLARGPIIRTVHAVLFEGLFMIATVPIIMYMMQMTFWMAFMTDITMTLVILGYTYVYNWVYDRARLYFVEA